MTAKHLYETIVLPKALYGCELWSNLLQKDIEQLEVAHRFCLKVIQSLPKLARTDVILSALGMLPIEAEIDKRKLIFFGQLCRLDTDITITRMFLNRICDYNDHPSKVIGFIPDIYSICNKYDLMHIILTYCNTGVFPSKFAWKTVVNKAIKLKQTSLLQERVTSDVTLCDYCMIQPLSEVKACIFWQFSRTNKEKLKLAQAAVKFTVLLFSKPYICKCRKCNNYTDNIAMHLSLECVETAEARSILWRRLLEYLGYDLFNTLSLMPLRSQLVHILSCLRHLRPYSEIEPECLNIVTTFCFRLLKHTHINL